MSWTQQDSGMGGMMPGGSVPPGMAKMRGAPDEYGRIPRPEYGGWVNTHFPASEGQGPSPYRWKYDQRAYGPPQQHHDGMHPEKEVNWDRMLLMAIVFFQAVQLFGRRDSNLL